MNRNDGSQRGNRRGANPGADGTRGRSQGGNARPATRFGPPGAGAPQTQKRRDDRSPRSDKSAAGAQPDPMKTSFGYIGADTFTRQRQDQGQGQGQGQGQRRGGGGNAGGFGGSSGGPRRNGGNTGGNRSGGNRGGNR